VPARIDPRRLAGALGAVAIVLALTGTAVVASEVIVSHPEALRFRAEGRHLEGEVYDGGFKRTAAARRLGPKGTRIGIDDPELGPQVIDVYGYFPARKHVPVLCLTAARHCMSADVVDARLAAWPYTPLMLIGTGELALAAALFAVGRLRRRQGRRLG
jgi:hypothetical protein